jgi:glutamate dehydrogenase
MSALMPTSSHASLPNAEHERIFQEESLRFRLFYRWLEEQMPHVFYEEVSGEELVLLAHTLMGLHLQDYFSSLHFAQRAYVLCIDTADADLKILKQYSMVGIKNYSSYVSKEAPPVPGMKGRLRIGTIYFTEAKLDSKELLTAELREEVATLIKQRNAAFSEQQLSELLTALNARFVRSLSTERLVLALDMFMRATTRDNCQYEVRYNEDWQDKGNVSMQIVLAWRNTPKNYFLYRMARLIHRHGLVMQRVNAAYVNAYSKESVLLMALGLHGRNGQSAWDVTDILDFLRELVTIKYFDSLDTIDSRLVVPGYITGNMGNLLRAMVPFIHQALVNINPYLYSLENITEGLCRHPELTAQLCSAFKSKFDPWTHDEDTYQRLRNNLLDAIKRIDTGHEENDNRRKQVLIQGVSFIHHTLKTNFYRMNMSALSFRLNPLYLDEIPFDRKANFPELPYAIIYIKGLHFFAFHIRFKDLARGGLRTIYPEKTERMQVEIKRVFSECYQLAYTQHKKNKDIPEGGAKAVIFIKPYEQLLEESEILSRELQEAQLPEAEIEQKVADFQREQKLEYLHHAQRSFIEALITIVNCDAAGVLRAKHIIDYWGHPEYLYLGPDENMHDSMIEWIANYSISSGYKPGSAFISGKPTSGINHKEYGVTSLGVNVYLEHVLNYLDINPQEQTFSIKMSGGPDGDVAGNQILNLQRYYPHTAKLVALTDVSGTIYDPKGLDLDTMAQLFHKKQSIRHYPPELLHDGGFLVDRDTQRVKNTLVQQTLCWKKRQGKVKPDWRSSNDMNHLWRNNIHNVTTDIFIPAGGRPRTLNGDNVSQFLDATGAPTARAIVEGANLYLDNDARHFLEERGVLIIKDSSANKTGVICSSFEVLCGLTLGDENFYRHKELLVKEILARLRQCAALEAQLLLSTYQQTKEHLTDISDAISARINLFTDQLLAYLEKVTLIPSPDDPLMRCFLNYCLPLLQDQFQEALLREIPNNHKKAVIACYIAADLVYNRGLQWSPSIADMLPVVLAQKPTIPDSALAVSNKLIQSQTGALSKGAVLTKNG